MPVTMQQVVCMVLIGSTLISRLTWPEALNYHINQKEVIAISLAAHRWAPVWVNKRIIVYSDNKVSVASINKGTSRNPQIMRCLRNLFWLAPRHNFHLAATYLPGVKNVLADGSSRLHLKGYVNTFLPYVGESPLFLHAPPKSLKFLFDRFTQWQQS